MGLKEKAVGFRRSLIKDRISHLEDYFAGRTLTREELADLRVEIEKRIRDAGGNLDRKLIDMQTLFEVGQELNSSFETGNLLEILLLTLMGQFRLSDAAVYLMSDGRPALSGRKGFPALSDFPAGKAAASWLAERDFVTADDVASDHDDIRQFLVRSSAAGIVPLISKDKPVGFLVLGPKPKSEPFTEEETGFIVTLASLSGIALDNARLYEELKAAYDRLDRKVSELSALYDISALINTSNDFSTVLDLLMETVSTGFGVKTGFLFTSRSSDASYTIRAQVGLDPKLNGRSITLFPDERKLLTENKTAVLPGEGRTRDFCPPAAQYLFVPLVGIDTRIGGLVITEFTGDTIKPGNADLVHLFSIIASLAGPPLALTQFIQEQKDRITDPLSPILDRMEAEIRKAKEFGVEAAFIMLKLKNLKKYVELFGPEETAARLDRLNRTLCGRIPAHAVPIRYSLNRFLFIVPGLVENDAADLKEVLQRCALEEFKSDRQMDIGVDALSVSSPASGDNALALLNQIE